VCQSLSAHARRCAAVSATAATLALASCTRTQGPPPFFLDTQLRPVADAMDGLSAKVEEFGTVTISSPLMSMPNSRFQFDLSAGPDDYYTEAQSEFHGTASAEDRIANSFGFAASGTADVSKFLNLKEGQRIYQRDRRRYEREQDVERARDDAEYRERVLAARAQRDAALRAAQADQDPAEKQKAITKAREDYITALAALPERGAGDAPEPPPAEEGEITPPDGLAKRPAELVEALSAMAAFQGLRPGAPARTLPNRGAMITAAGDATTEYILSHLVDPTVAGNFRGKKVLFGVSMVSVNPGWRTHKGYAADIAILCKYHFGTARRSVVEAFVRDPAVDPAVRLRVAADYGLQPPQNVPPGTAALAANAKLPDALLPPPPEDGDPTPLVAAVSPMTETQALDLASSRRRQDEFSLNLSFVLRYLGLGGQANAFEKFARQQQSDVATATANVAANAYSHEGGMFGFQVGPRLVAVERVRKGKASGAAEVLERQSFPALILFGFDRRDLVRVRWESEGSNTRLNLSEARLALLSAPSWMPVTRQTSTVRFSERERLRWSRDLGAALGGLPNPATPGSTAFLAQFRAEALRYKAFGGGLYVDLPEELFSEEFGVRPPADPAPTRGGGGAPTAGAASGAPPETPQQ
jgi:hypothetical protein